MQSIVFTAILTLIWIPAAAARAQTASDEQAVRARVEEFLTKLGSRDVEGVRAMLAPKAAIIVVRQQKEGGFASSHQSGDEFMAQLEKNAGGPMFEEPLTHVLVTVDSGALAYVRANFTVVHEGKVLSSGVDQFTLVKNAGVWKIAAVAYTSTPAQTATR
jgi:ketosteroid isomerase-like protein